jgi:tetratricopeptide (TPR) repeat protein
LDAFQSQSEGAIARKDWDAAIHAIQGGIKLAPGDIYWTDKLADIESTRHQAALDAYREEADKARAAGNWNAAVTALGSYLQLEPGDSAIQAEISQIREEKHQYELAKFKSQAEAAAQAERWEEAVQAWENTLDLGPEERTEVEATLYPEETLRSGHQPPARDHRP